MPPPEVVAAVREALGDGFHFGEDHPLQVEWAQLVQKLIPAAERVRFVNSGTEATLLALRLARAFTGKSKMLRFEGHYHGWHDYAGKGTMLPFDEAMSAGIADSVLDAIVVVPADLQAVEAALSQDPDIGVVILEPTGASWGTAPLTVEFNRGLRELTADRGVPLILDEVVSGFRYSPGGYQAHAGLVPDLTTLGKIAAGGMPGGLVAGRAEIMQLFDYTGDAHHDRYERVLHLGTFNANPVAAAAAVATLRQVEGGGPNAVADAMAARLREGIARILEEERVAGFAYGESSIFHVYLEAHPGSGANSAEELRTSDPTVLKGMPAALIAALHKNLQIRGIKFLSYNGGVTSSAHTVEDIEKTLGVIREVLAVLLREQLAARLGGS